MNYTEIEIEGMKEILKDKEEYIKKLEIDKIHWRDLYWEECEKNKKLKEELEKSKECGVFRQEENNTLKNNAMEDMKVQTELEEKIRFLEQCLDNKEKVNKSMREELEWYHGFDNYLTNHGFDMKKLKSELEILKLTAKDYAKQCGVDLDDDLSKL